MRYFTRGWANGELGEAEVQEKVRAYQQHLRAIDGRLSKSARLLAHEVHLHDAVIERTRWNPSDARLTLSLVTKGSEPCSVELTYLGALLGVRPLEALAAASRDREAELLYDEVDLDDDGLFLHRLLFWPREELTITCRDMHLNIEARADARIALGPSFLVED